MKYKKYGSVLLVLALLMVLIATSELLRQQTLPAAEGKAREYHHSICRVSAGCRLDLQEGSIDLLIKPYTMPVLQPLQIDVRVAGLKPESVSLEFVGRDMVMGLMPHNLELQRQSAHPWQTNLWHYHGEALITFCPADRNMVWLAQVVVESDQLIRTTVFELENQ